MHNDMFNLMPFIQPMITLKALTVILTLPFMNNKHIVLAADIVNVYLPLLS